MFLLKRFFNDSIETFDKHLFWNIYSVSHKKHFLNIYFEMLKSVSNETFNKCFLLGQKKRFKINVLKTFYKCLIWNVFFETDLRQNETFQKRFMFAGQIPWWS